MVRSCRLSPGSTPKWKLKETCFRVGPSRRLSHREKAVWVRQGNYEDLNLLITGSEGFSLNVLGANLAMLKGQSVFNIFRDLNLSLREIEFEWGEPNPILE